MTLKTMVHEAEEGGYWAEVPALPGCSTQGETLESNLKEAIELWLEAGDSDTDKSSEHILEVAV